MVGIQQTVHMCESATRLALTRASQQRFHALPSTLVLLQSVPPDLTWCSILCASIYCFRSLDLVSSNSLKARCMYALSYIPPSLGTKYTEAIQYMLVGWPKGDLGKWSDLGSWKSYTTACGRNLPHGEGVSSDLARCWAQSRHSIYVNI